MIWNSTVLPEISLGGNRVWLEQVNTSQTRCHAVHKREMQEERRGKEIGGGEEGGGRKDKGLYSILSLASYQSDKSVNIWLVEEAKLCTSDARAALIT